MFNFMNDKFNKKQKRPPSNLIQTTRECVYFWSHNKDGGRTSIRLAIAETLMFHANSRLCHL